MKVLITGAYGQLGYHLKQTFADCQCYLADLANYDITKPAIVNRETEQFKPELIIHGAAYTNVDGAETNKELCRKINVDGSRNVAVAAKNVGAKIIAISTDYVFDGKSKIPYKESDPPNPASYYGQTKLEGEQTVAETLKEHFICRTAWLYGGPKPRFAADLDSPIKNFVLTMLKLGLIKDSLQVVGDQIGSPTYAADFADSLRAIANTDRYGLYHCTNSGQASWAEFAELIFQKAGINTKVRAISSKDWAKLHPEATKRPMFSVLANNQLVAVGLPALRPWQEALNDFLADWVRKSDQRVQS